MQKKHPAKNVFSRLLLRLGLFNASGVLHDYSIHSLAGCLPDTFKEEVKLRDCLLCPQQAENRGHTNQALETEKKHPSSDNKKPLLSAGALNVTVMKEKDVFKKNDRKRLMVLV